MSATLQDVTAETTPSKRPRHEDPVPQQPSVPTPKTSHLAPELLKCVPNAVSITTPRPEVSHFLPNFTMLMATVAIADNYLVSNNYRFLQQNPTWHTILTRIYAGIICYIQTLRVMRHMRTIAPQDLVFILTFEREFPLESIPVPSYMEPFFKSITSTTSEYKEYGLIGPRLPPINLTVEEGLVFPTLERSYLPDLVCLYRGYQNLIRPGNAQTQREFDRNLIDPTANQMQPIGPESPNPVTRDARLAPGLKEIALLGNRTPLAYSATPGLIPVPQHPLEPITNWQQYLFPTDNMNWFSRLLLLMHEYCTCWPNSKNMSILSPYDGQMPLVEIQYTTIYENPPRENELREFNDEAQGSLRTITVPEEVVKLSAFSQVHATHHHTYIPGIPNQQQIFNATHAGPYWNIAPIRQTIPTYNALLLVPEALSHLHITYARRAVN